MARKNSTQPGAMPYSVTLVYKRASKDITLWARNAGEAIARAQRMSHSNEIRGMFAAPIRIKEDA